MTKEKRYEIDMCSGPLFGKILLFAIPLMMSGILQLLFNAADVIVVGNFVGESALAAVGSTTSLINLLINVFIGLSIGTNVLVARFYGAGQEQEVRETVHTAIALALLCGVFLIGVGMFASGPMLKLMGTPDEVLGQAILYVRIYFLGMPVNLLYNFGSAILRAVGDTRRPLYYLSASGVINVLLNISFICFFGMGVEGVALATIISQAIAAVLILYSLIRNEGVLHLELSRLRITGDKLKRILRVGLPAGIQSAIFSASNVLIQSSINSFGFLAVAGSTAACNLECFVYAAMNACHHAAISFIGQNLGAGKLDRVRRVIIQCILLVSAVGLVMGVSFYLFGEQLLSIYTRDPEALWYGLRRLAFICIPYFIFGIMDTLAGCVRGLGYSVLPMMVSVAGVCGLRVLWIFTVFQWYPTWDMLFSVYLFTWVVTATVHLMCLITLYRKQKKMIGGEIENE